MNSFWFPFKSNQKAPKRGHQLKRNEPPAMLFVPEKANESLPLGTQAKRVLRVRKELEVTTHSGATKSHDKARSRAHMAVVQNQWYHFGVGAPPVFVYVSGDWGVHCTYGVLKRALASSFNHPSVGTYVFVTCLASCLRRSAFGRGPAARFRRCLVAFSRLAVHETAS